MPSDSNCEALATLFSTCCSLDPTKSQEASKNPKLSTLLHSILQKAGAIEKGCTKAQGQLFYLLAAKISKEGMEHLDFLIQQINESKLKTEAQLLAALRYVSRVNHIEAKEFDTECGVGANPSEQEILEAIQKVLKESPTTPMSQLIRAVKEIGQVKWADGKIVKMLFDQEYSKVEKIPQSKSTTLPNPTPSAPYLDGEVARLHRPGENKQLTPQIMQAHLAATGGKVITRFPPEPNGFLHIGHAKAINLNFSYAALHGGHCYLRYDDTNPEAEEKIYVDSILESVRWLGYEPWKITYASDHFPALYQLAVQMIKADKAYICHMTQEQIKESRGGDDKQGPRFDSPWRNRPISESLDWFNRMKQGLVAEGEAVLRMKQDMQSPNPFMWDMVAYRVLKKHHVRTGDEWCIYPTYDFTHCLCDSLENITHSLCTKEFIAAHECYDWVCDALEVYKARQWEYAKLQLTDTILSKRNLTKLIQAGFVHGWDDPRIFSLAGMRRRGYTPAAINRFVQGLGVTTNSPITELSRLENVLREDLDATSPRVMVVLDAIKVTITDVPEGHVEWIEVPDFPSDLSRGMKKVPFSRNVLIERGDFEVEGAALAQIQGYKRLYPGGTVGLFRSRVIRCTGWKADSEGKVISIEAETVQDSSVKPGTFIHWVADCPAVGSPVWAEARIYAQHLFKSKFPSQAEGGFLGDVRPASETLQVLNAVACDVRLAGAWSIEDKFQFQRIGYFCVDRDSDVEKKKLVFNKTIGLRE